MERTLAALGDSLTDKQRKSIEAMGRAIVNKLLHGPTAKLRAVHTGPDGDRLAGPVCTAREEGRAEATREAAAAAGKLDARSAKR